MRDLALSGREVVVVVDVLSVCVSVSPRELSS